MVEPATRHDGAGLTAGVIEGDAFDLIKAVDEGSVDLILTSPPYWGLRTYGHPHEEGVLGRWIADGLNPNTSPPYDWYRNAGGVLGLEPLPEWYVSHLVEWFSRAKPKLAESGSLWVNLGDTFFARWGSIRDGGRQGIAGERTRRRTPVGGYLHDKQLLMVPARFAIAMQDAGWILRNDLIWSKGRALPGGASDRLRSSHEHWFHFVKRSPKGRPAYFYDLEAAEDGALDVVECSPAPGAASHTATFPSGIVRPRILTSSPVGGLVLDPFCGTGTAVVEAVSLGRRGLGFELSMAYAQAAAAETERIIEASGSGQHLGEDVDG